MLFLQLGIHLRQKVEKSCVTMSLLKVSPCSYHGDLHFEMELCKYLRLNNYYELLCDTTNQRR